MSPFHDAYGGMASSKAPPELQSPEVGAPRSITSDKAAPQAEARPRTFGQRAKRRHAAAGTMPRQRRGKGSSQGVRQQLLRRTSSTGRGMQRRIIQSGRTQRRSSDAIARGRGGAFHTTIALRRG